MIRKVDRYRFVGGPLHGERHETYGHREWLVPVREPLTVAAMTGDPSAHPGVKVAVYERTGDYPAEWFYKFTKMDRR